MIRIIDVVSTVKKLAPETILIQSTVNHLTTQIILIIYLYTCVYLIATYKFIS